MRVKDRVIDRVIDRVKTTIMFRGAYLIYNILRKFCM